MKLVVSTCNSEETLMGRPLRWNIPKGAKLGIPIFVQSDLTNQIFLLWILTYGLLFSCILLRFYLWHTATTGAPQFFSCHFIVKNIWSNFLLVIWNVSVQLLYVFTDLWWLLLTDLWLATKSHLEHRDVWQINLIKTITLLIWWN